MMFENKHIVVGISGGIAAFKAAGLVSQLRQKGADVHCIMTANAAKLVTPITFGELSGNDVTVDMFANISKWDVEHIALAKLADLFVVAPATADIIGKVANGIADDMLSTTIMATKAKVLFVPSMNTIGKNTATSVMVVEMTAKKISLAPSMPASFGGIPFSMRT